MKLSKATLTEIIFSILLFFTSSAYAQESNPTNLKNSYLKISLSYLTNSVYYGRKDSLSVPYITPEISFHDKSGFYIQGSLWYLAGTGAQIDAGSLTLGYEFSSKNEKISGDLYASKYFVSGSSYSVRGEIKGSVGGSLYYNTGPLSLNAGVNASISNKTDVALNFGLSHQFEFTDNKRWAITPSVLVNGGTQNFYENYYTHRKYSQKRKRRLTQNTNNVNVIVMNKSFSILDYELSMPIDYTDHKWGLFFMPTFSIPENGFKYSLNNGATYQSEILSNSFYAEVGAYIKF